MSYVYIQSEPSLWTVGFYDPWGKWHPDSDHGTKDEAAVRVMQMNGQGDDTRRIGEIRALLATFDWEHDDRQYALEQIEMIAEGGQP